MKLKKNKKTTIAIIGLGYVGLPLAVEFAKQYNTIGYDINSRRINELKKGIDSTLEVKKFELIRLFDTKLFKITNILEDISSCNTYIVTVPTPTDKNNRPVLQPLLKATESIGTILKNGDIVIYESTVYPGVTEDECVPILEKISGLKLNLDFFVGYSPERINPGDKIHTVANILKVTSGSNEESAEIIDNLYKSIITAGTFKATSIKVAEAAKVIENSQRDINIAFVNELSKIFTLMGIDTQEVLKAASTKWNFLNFSPGLVGGHCIGVDPYYLAQKAQELGYHSEIILAGRRMNDSMGGYVADQVIKLMLINKLQVVNSKILVLGFTFKENCPDIRNSKVIDVVRKLKNYHADVFVFDPWANNENVFEEYGFEIFNDLNANKQKFDAIILAVAHDKFLSVNISDLKKNEKSVVFDVKGILIKNNVNGRL